MRLDHGLVCIQYEMNEMNIRKKNDQSQSNMIGKFAREKVKCTQVGVPRICLMFLELYLSYIITIVFLYTEYFATV